MIVGPVLHILAGWNSGCSTVASGSPRVNPVPGNSSSICSIENRNASELAVAGVARGLA